MWSKLLIVTTISNHGGQLLIPGKDVCFITFSVMHDMEILVVEFRGYYLVKDSKGFFDIF